MCKKRRILYIDDDAQQLALVQSYLERNLDVVVDTCQTAAGAEVKLNQTTFCLLIVDIGLPDFVDGIDIARCVLARDPDQEIMLFSEYNGNASIEEGAAQLGLTITPKFSGTSPADFLRLVHEKVEKRDCVECELVNGNCTKMTRPLKLIAHNITKARATNRAQAIAATAHRHAHLFCLICPWF